MEGLTALASAIGVSATTVHEWKMGKRPVPEKRCVQIEQITLGRVTRQQLRPGDWIEIWPELATQAPQATEAAGV